MSAHTRLGHMLAYAAHDPSLPVWTCRGSGEEWAEANRLLDQTDSILIDPSALGTLFLTNAFKHLPAIPKRLVVTEGALAELDREIEHLSPGEGGGIAVQIGTVRRFVPYDDPDLTASREKLQAFREALNRQATVIGGQAIGRLAPDVRENLVHAVGQASVESIATAATQGHLLWTDDVANGDLMGEFFEKTRTWTQAVFDWALAEQCVTTGDYASIVGSLLACDYRFTRLTTDVFCALGASVDWDQNAQPFTSAISHFKLPTIVPVTLVQLLLQIAVRLRRLDMPDSQLAQVTQALLTTVAERPDGPTLVATVHDRAFDAFGIDGAGAINLRFWAAQAITERRGFGSAILLPGLPYGSVTPRFGDAESERRRTAPWHRP